MQLFTLLVEADVIIGVSGMAFVVPLFAEESDFAEAAVSEYIYPLILSLLCSPLLGIFADQKPTSAPPHREQRERVRRHYVCLVLYRAAAAQPDLAEQFISLVKIEDVQRSLPRCNTFCRRVISNSQRREERGGMRSVVLSSRQFWFRVFA